MDHGPLLDLRLSQNPVFAGLTVDLRERIASGATVRTYERSEVVARELEASKQFLLLLDGGVEICRHAEDGGKTVFRTVYPPTGIGYLLLSGEPHTADVVAADTALVALIPVALLKDVFGAQPAALYKVIARLAELVDALSGELLEHRSLPLLERVRRAIYRNADQYGRLQVSHEALAQYVGATRANVSRALKKLEAGGCISCGRRTIQINQDP